MTERSSWAVRVSGAPAPKGSLKCIGRRGKSAHNLIENNTRTKPWRDAVAYAGRRLRTEHNITEPLDGALGIVITFTVDLPPSIKPGARLWPFKRSSGLGGDLDKLARTVLDGLEDSGIFHDDAQVCELSAVKAYPHTGVPDGLLHPGALIRIYRLSERSPS